MPSPGPDNQPHESDSDRRRVLVVEDDQNVRTVIKAQLEEGGHEVHTAADGKAGLARFISGHWDVVLTDRMMPEMNGDELAAAIKRIAPNMPVVLVTGYADQRRDPTLGASPFAMVIRKPFTLGTLNAAVTAVCAKQG